MTEKVSRLLERCTRTLRTVIGAPDYERYVEHMRSAHPGSPILSRSDFARERLTDRYARPGSRCC